MESQSPTLFKKLPTLSQGSCLISVCEMAQIISVLGQEDPLEKEMATHCSILAWVSPWTEEPGGLQSMGSQIV